MIYQNYVKISFKNMCTTQLVFVFQIKIPYLFKSYNTSVIKKIGTHPDHADLWSVTLFCGSFMDIFDAFINVSGTSFIPFVLIIKQSFNVHKRKEKKIKCAHPHWPCRWTQPEAINLLDNVLLHCAFVFLLEMNIYIKLPTGAGLCI